MAIYDINGNSLSGSTKTVANTEYDYWKNAKNPRGTKGYMTSTTIDYTGELKTQAGYSTSGYIPTYDGLMARFSDLSKISKNSAKVFYYNASYEKVAKGDLTISDDGIISLAPNMSSKYMLVTFPVSSNDFTLNVEKPINPYLVDNKYVHAFWKNTHYIEDDYSYTEMSKYISAGQSEIGVLRNPKSVVLKVKQPAVDYDSIKVKVSKNPSFNVGSTITNVIYSPYVTIRNLEVETTYYVRVIGVLNNVETIIDEYHFDTEGYVRLLTTGVSNTRDIGNKQTQKWGKLKQGQIIRCAKLDDASSGAFNTLTNLGVVAELDLRDESEVDPNYTSPFEYYRVSIGSSQGLAQHTYNRFAAAFKKAVELLAANKPFCIHCKGGADRTGAICAIFEGVCGVSQDEIDKDYELTALNTTGTTRNDLEDDNHWFSEGQLATQACPGDTIADRYAYVLLQGGATQAEIDTFRKLMLTEYC